MECAVGLTVGGALEMQLLLLGHWTCNQQVAGSTPGHRINQSQSQSV